MLKSWEILTTPVDYADPLLGLDCPMLLVKHEGCLMNTEEGFEDAVEALPEADRRPAGGATGQPGIRRSPPSLLPPHG